MKKLVVLVVFGLLTISTFAQKLGHINSGEVLQLLMNEEGVVKKLKGVYADQLGTMFKKYTGMNVRL